MQVFCGLVFSDALWFVKDCFLYQHLGWLKLWGLLVGLSILSSTGPSPGSIEGLIYKKTPVLDQLKAYIEMLPQTLLFSLSVFFWYQKSKKIWNVSSIILVSILVLLVILGLLARNFLI